MSGGTSDVETKQGSTVPKFQVPHLREIFGEASRMYWENPLQAYSGQLLAGFDPAETAGQRSLLNYAGGRGGQLAGQTGDALGFLLSGDVLSPESNPYLAQSAEAAVRPVTQALTEQALPAIRGEAIASGGLGSSAQGIAEAQAVERSQRAALDATSNIYSNAYNQGLGAYTQGIALSPQAYQLGMQPGLTQAGVGAQRRGLEQAGFDTEQQQFYLEQSLPLIALSQYLGFAGGQYGGTGTSTTTQPATFWERIGLGNIF